MEALNRQQKSDIKLLGKFVEVYCSGKHGATNREPFALPGGLGQRNLCLECADFLGYAIARRMKCPLEAEKPTCKRCRIHCYAPPRRQLVREIMGYAGRRLIMRGRLDYLFHYLF